MAKPKDGVRLMLHKALVYPLYTFCRNKYRATPPLLAYLLPVKVINFILWINIYSRDGINSGVMDSRKIVSDDNDQ